MSWQWRCLNNLDLIPELGFCSRFYAKMMSKYRIFPGTLDADGKVVPITEGLPVELLNRIRDPGGGRAQIQGAYGTMMFTTGEGYLFGRDLDSTDERWMFVWAAELQFDDGSIIWQPREDEPARTYTRGEQAEAYRMWTPHPRRSGEPNSPMRSVTEGGIADELILLTKSVSATATSRLVNGILAMPQEISPGPLEAVGDEDPENDPFMTDFIEHASSQIENPGTAEARIPFVVWGAAEYIDQIRQIAIHDPQTDYMEQGLRKEAVERMAHGLDMPPEWLIGMGQANHWSARQILSDMWPSHGEPIGQQWRDDLNIAYLRPALREANYEGWDEVVIGGDPSSIVVNPDRGKDADEAWDRGAIGYRAYREAKNFKERDAQTPEERDEWLAIKLRNEALLGGEGVVPGARGPARKPAQRAPDAAEGPADPGPQGVTRQESQNARILGAAELAIIRCRELAGARIRSKQHACPDCLEPANGKPNALVASLVGAEGLATLGVAPARQLVKNGTDSFRALMESWQVDPLVTDLLATIIEEHAAKSLTTAAVGLPDEFVKAVNGHALVEAA